jgi:hypothetical protein
MINVFELSAMDVSILLHLLVTMDCRQCRTVLAGRELPDLRSAGVTTSR